MNKVQLMNHSMGDQNASVIPVFWSSVCVRFVWYAIYSDSQHYFLSANIKKKQNQRELKNTPAIELTDQPMFKTSRGDLKSPTSGQTGGKCILQSTKHRKDIKKENLDPPAEYPS